MEVDADRPMCDLVMKGGITSGVIYPRLISVLADKYRFKNIGGTSAGAIAAAGCAAAEHRRLTTGQAEGFAELDKLPGKLNEPVGQDKRSRLFHLFQPAPDLSAHFAVLASMLNQDRLGAVGNALLALVRQFYGIALLGAALSILLLFPALMVAMPDSGWLSVGASSLVILGVWWAWVAMGARSLGTLRSSPALKVMAWWSSAFVVTALALWVASETPSAPRVLVSAFVAGVVSILTMGCVAVLVMLRFAWTLVHGMHANGYGLCRGRTVNGGAGKPEGLTDWLTGYFNELAGLAPDRPLTFGDLWGARFDGTRFHGDPTAERRVNLEVMTTAVSQRMGFAIPFRDGQALYYDPTEWKELFPAVVMQWLDAASAAEADDPSRKQKVPDDVVFGEGGSRRRLSRLPSNENLPVIVAVRMSLSFPVLLSAVPLYAVDFTRRQNQRREGMPATEKMTLTAKRIWFSDGGISSNLPLHFFDAPLPGHPTFAINLKDEHPDFRIQPAQGVAGEKNRVYLPEDNGSGRLRYWPDPADTHPMTGLVGFFMSMIDTMQNWRDEIQFPYPGYRDRIVQVSLRSNEGGLNLDMPKGVIAALGDAGEAAARRLMARFLPPDPPASEGWKNHQDIRLRAFLGAVEHMVLSLEPQLASGRWDTVVDAVDSRNYTHAHKRVAKQYLRLLHDMAEATKASGVSLEDRAHRPRPSMRMAPRV